MKVLKTFLSAVIAGLAIGIGGVVFLTLESKILGALFFTVGLFTICTFGLNLFTGKVCYVFDNDKSYALNLITIWLGNLAGTALMAGLLNLTRLAPALTQKAQALAQVKMSDSLLSLYILGIFCDILIYIAVEGYKNNPHELGKYLSIFFGVTLFILCGFEHSIADMFYFFMAGSFNLRAFLCILVISLGNAVGGVILPLLRKYIARQ